MLLDMHFVREAFKSHLIEIEKELWEIWRKEKEEVRNGRENTMYVKLFHGKEREKIKWKTEACQISTSVNVSELPSGGMDGQFICRTSSNDETDFKIMTKIAHIANCQLYHAFGTGIYTESWWLLIW